MSYQYFYRVKGMDRRPDLNGWLIEVNGESNSPFLERVSISRDEFLAARAEHNRLKTNG